MANNLTDITAASGITVTDWVVGLMAFIVIGIITAIIIYSLKKWGSEYIKLSPVNRPNLLNFIIVLIIILAIIIFGLTKNLDSDAITTLLGAIAGYIFGVTTDPKLFKSSGMDNKPFAKIKIIKSPGIIGNPVSFDGSSSVDPAGNPLQWNWSISSKPNESTTADIDNSKAVNPSFTPDVKGTYEVTLIVNNGTQDSDPATVQIEISDV